MFLNNVCSQNMQRTFTMQVLKLVASLCLLSVQLHFFSACFNNKIEPQHRISNNVVCATSKGSDQPTHTCSLFRAFACRLNIL